MTFFKNLLQSFATKVADDVFGFFLLILVAFVAVGGAYGIYQLHLKDEATTKAFGDAITGQVDKYQQLTASTAKLETDYVTTQKLLADAKAGWATEIAKNKRLQAEIKGLISVTMTTKGQPAVTQKATEATPGLYYQEIAYLNGPPVGYVEMSTASNGMATWRLFDHTITVNSAVTVDPKTGKAGVISKGFYTLTDTGTKDPQWVGKPFPLSVTAGSLDYTPGGFGSAPTEKGFLWAVHPEFGVTGFGTSSGLDWGIRGGGSFAGYGLDKNTLDWRFLDVGLTANRSYLDLDVQPAAIRIPYLSNTFAGPGLGFGTRGTTYSIGISTNL